MKKKSLPVLIECKFNQLFSASLLFLDREWRGRLQNEIELNWLLPRESQKMV
jgi:hypothetical protein